MTLPPVAPGHVVLQTQADLDAYIARDSAMRFDCVVRFVAKLPSDDARHAFLIQARERHSPELVQRVREAVWKKLQANSVPSNVQCR